MALLESRAPRDPLTLFRRWYGEAEKAGAPQPDAIALATRGSSGPSVRMVLFKGIEDGAFQFYSNYESRKGRDLAANKRAALVFYWSVTRHQVRVSGTVRRLGRDASLAYFASRQRRFGKTGEQVESASPEPASGSGAASASGNRS